MWGCANDSTNARYWRTFAHLLHALELRFCLNPNDWEQFMEALTGGVGRRVTPRTLHSIGNVSHRDMFSAATWITATCLNLRLINFWAPNPASLSAMLPITTPLVALWMREATVNMVAYQDGGR